MNIREIQQKFFRCRDAEGKLDLDALMVEDRLATTYNEPKMSAADQRRLLRRAQGWPEYLIDKDVEQLKKQPKRHIASNATAVSKRPH